MESSHTNALNRQRYEWDGEDLCFRMPAGHHSDNYVDPRTLPPEIFYNRDRDGIMECEDVDSKIEIASLSKSDVHHGIRWKRQEISRPPLYQPLLHDLGSYEHYEDTFEHQLANAGYHQNPPPANFTLHGPIYGIDGIPVFEHQMYGTQSLLASNVPTKPLGNLPTPPDTHPRQAFTTTKSQADEKPFDRIYADAVKPRSSYFNNNYSIHNALQMEGSAEYDLPRMAHIPYIPEDCPSNVRQYVAGCDPVAQYNQSISSSSKLVSSHPPLPLQQTTKNCNLSKSNEADSVTVSDSASNMYPKPPRLVQRQYSQELRAMGIIPEALVNKHHFQGCFHDGECADTHEDQGVADHAVTQPFGFSGRTQSTLPTNTSSQVDSDGHYKPVKAAQFLQQISENPKARYPYKEVHALLLHWEQDYAYVDAKAMKLRCLLWVQYQVQVQRVTIPHVSSHSFVRTKIQEWINDQSHYDALLVVYYVGGATSTAKTGMTWFPLTNRADPLRGSLTYPKVHWEAPQSDLEQADSDVLLIFDTSGSNPTPPSSTSRPHQRQATTELLASFENEDSFLRYPSLTFTSNLITQLKKFHERSEMFSVAELHRGMVNQWNREVMQKREVQKSVVPFYMRVNGKAGSSGVLLLPVEMTIPRGLDAVVEPISDIF